MQSAVNAAALYVSEAIGRSFGYGENKNETTRTIEHFLLAAAVSRVNGGNFAAGGSAAVAAEKAAEHLNGITTVKLLWRKVFRRH